MMINIRCWSCGKPIGHLYEEYLERVENREDKSKVLTDLGLTRYCCRSQFLGHVNAIDDVAPFKKG